MTTVSTSYLPNVTPGSMSLRVVSTLCQKTPLYRLRSLTDRVSGKEKEKEVTPPTFLL